MHRHFVAGLALLGMLGPFAQAGRAQAWSPTLAPAAMQRDFDVLKSALEEAHGALYRFVPKAEMDRRFAATRGRLDHTMTRREFIGTLNELIAVIGDGHARLILDDSTNS